MDFSGRGLSSILLAADEAVLSQAHCCGRYVLWYTLLW